MVEVLVEHDYIAKEPNELTITKGDIIKDVVKKQGGWWEGTLNDKKGLFPDNFVKVIDKDASVILRNRKDASRIRQCRVVFSYKQDHEDELNLNVGEIVDILGEEEEGWWRGLLNGKEGVFPSNFVEEIVPPKIYSSKENLNNNTSQLETTPPLLAKPTTILCEVKFAYKAQNEDELTLKEGDLVTLISKEGQDQGWWKGELNGLIGVFPDNFVTILQANNEDKRPKTHTENFPTKAFSVVSTHRRSQEIQNEKPEPAISSSKTTPPVPSKKPLIKKSPSNSGPHLNLFKNIADAVDGAFISKISHPKTEPQEPVTAENAFDNVLRRPLLSDVRVSRPKAPGRRPPSIVGKDLEPGVMNGDADHAIVEPLPESPPAEGDTSESKPKLREWEKHKAPWLAEMKLNQAKRGSSVPPSDAKLKLATTEKTTTNDSEEIKSSQVVEKEPSPNLDKSKSTSNVSLRIKTAADFPVVRSKSNLPAPPRPQTIQNIGTISDTYLPKQGHKAPSPVTNRAPSLEQQADDSVEDVPPKKYSELVQRITRLEELLEKQRQSHETAIEDLKGKLQIETELRMKLQVKFERFTTDGAVHQI